MECFDLPPFLFARDRQLNSTFGKEQQMQREMAVHGEPKKLQNVPLELLKMCEDELDAVRLCIQLSGHTHEFIGKKLSIDKGHFSRMMQGQAGFPTHKRVRLMELCSNRAPVQFEVMQVGLGDEQMVSEDTSLAARVDELEAENAALKNALAAMLNVPKAA
jgi:hypothetical protein